MEQLIFPAIIASFVAFFSVLLLTPFLIKFLEKRNLTVKDYNRKGGAMVSRPGGISLIFGLVSSLLVLYVFIPINEILAVVIVSSLSFVVGLIDDRRVMGGWFKPVCLALCAIPILILGTYETNLSFPLFGSVQIPLLYLALAIFMIPITGNTINSIDVLNGVSSGFVSIASFSLFVCLIILENYEIAVMSLLLGFVSIAFYRFHKFPSKIFPGDSGALVLGATFGTIAIVGEVEVIAAISLLPAITNSFLFLSSVKKIVEHREIKNPTFLTNDYKIAAKPDKDAPVTLVRLLVAKTPLTEKQVGTAIFKLGILSGILAIITAIFMEINLV